MVNLHFVLSTRLILTLLTDAATRFKIRSILKKKILLIHLNLQGFLQQFWVVYQILFDSPGSYNPNHHQLYLLHNGSIMDTVADQMWQMWLLKNLCCVTIFFNHFKIEKGRICKHKNLYNNVQFFFTSKHSLFLSLLLG